MSEFFSWHYTTGLKKFFEIFKNFLIFNWNYFSIGRFLRTLLSSWRRDVSRVYQKGLHPVLFLQALIENIFTRSVGAILKLFIIFFGLFFEILTFAIFILFFFVFVFSLLSPIFALLGIFYFLFGYILEGIFFIVIFIPSFISLLLSFSSFREEKKDYSTMKLYDLSKEKWFGRVLNRIGIDKKDLNQEVFLNQKETQEFLRKLDITEKEFSKIIDWELSNQIKNKEDKKFWKRKNLMSVSPIGRYWSYAYTNKLDSYSVDLLTVSKYQETPTIERENEFQELEKLLLRSSQNNILVIGEPGTGRNALIQSLAKKIQTSQLGKPLDDKRLLELNIKEILAEHPLDNSGEEILENLFTEATYAGNIILVLKDIHDYLDSEGKDISSILSQFLALPTFQVIGTTDSAEFHSKIEKKSSLMKYFEKISLEEMDSEKALQVLFCKLKKSEKEQVIFTFQSLREIVKLTDRYVKNVPFPEKALDILEEVMLCWRDESQEKFVTAQLVNKTLSEKFGISLGEIETQENEKLMHLEDYLHQQIIGQNFAVRQIAETMRRARVGMADKNKPLGSFLFLGPTGVGKTESAKALASAYFGDENRMIRIDMSEYQMQDSIDRLIGSQESNIQGHLVSKVKETPFSLLLLDEIEKAHSDILNLFLQILDEGFLTDAFGKKISFSNLIIIATSNVGSEIIKESLQNKTNPENLQKQLIDYATREGIFRPEFLNRFEAIVFFHPLTQEETIQVTNLLLKKYSKKLQEQQNIGVSFEEGVAEIIAKNSYAPEFGARAIDRYIKDKVEDRLVEKIISGELQKGTDFILKVSDLEV